MRRRLAILGLCLAACAAWPAGASAFSRPRLQPLIDVAPASTAGFRDAVIGSGSSQDRVLARAAATADERGQFAAHHAKREGPDGIDRIGNLLVPVWFFQMKFDHGRTIGPAILIGREAR